MAWCDILESIGIIDNDIIRSIRHGIIVLLLMVVSYGKELGRFREINR